MRGLFVCLFDLAKLPPLRVMWVPVSRRPPLPGGRNSNQLSSETRRKRELNPRCLLSAALTAASPQTLPVALHPPQLPTSLQLPK